MPGYLYYQVLRILGRNAPQALRDFLFREGCLGMEPEKAGSLKAFFNEPYSLDAMKEKLKLHFPKAIILDSWKIGLPLPPQAPSWFPPFQLGGKYWVLPTKEGGEDYGPNKIFLDPGMAFGSGRHESTQLMASLIVIENTRPPSLLDVGVGSGVLTILAKLEGITQVDGVEIAPEALEQARINFLYNEIEDFKLFNRLHEVEGRYGWILANMTAPTLIHLAKELSDRLLPRGKIFLSGFLPKEGGEVKEAFRGFKIQNSLKGMEFEAICLEKK